MSGLAARHAGRAHEVGTIEVRQRADLLLLRADPTVDMGALRLLETVILNGRVLDAQRLAAARQGASLRARRHRAAPACGCGRLRWLRAD
ncbi:MAG TPA: hypothetical protein VFZ24_12405 [Longimicrobiales bacterium]